MNEIKKERHELLIYNRKETQHCKMQALQAWLAIANNVHKIQFPY